MKHLPLYMILLLFLAACAGRRADYPERLQRASQLVEARPDSALGYLDSLGMPLSGLPEEARMYAQLLRIKANDKLYIPHTSDSVINRIVKFYEGSATASGWRRLILSGQCVPRPEGCAPCDSGLCNVQPTKKARTIRSTDASTDSLPASLLTKGLTGKVWKRSGRLIYII